jgi:hypothetical protein
MASTIGIPLAPLRHTLRHRQGMRHFVTECCNEKKMQNMCFVLERDARFGFFYLIF